MLNVNELANSLKPVVLPGEIMKVFILKEGKEYNQGVAYLDDGTMVVVDNARKMISKTIDIVVTSVLQTTAGKMIFGRYIEARSARSRSGRSRCRARARRRATGPGHTAGLTGSASRRRRPPVAAGCAIVSGCLSITTSRWPFRTARQPVLPRRHDVR